MHPLRRGAGAHRGSEAGIKGSSWWRRAQPLGGALILGVLLAQWGTGAFVAGLRAVDVRALTVAAAVAAVSTACAAWRWRLVARCLHAELSMPSAVAACYRAQFLNVVLPGGVLGDVDRGVRHGRGVDDVGRGLRAVAWERTSGQVVLVAATLAALLMSRPPASSDLVVTLLVLIATGIGVAGVARATRRPGLSRRPGPSRRPGAGGRIVRVAVADARALAAPPALVGIVAASLVVLAGHVATFALAAHTVGVDVPTGELLPVCLVVLLVAAVPLNLAGWGPREGAAAWVFAAVGTGAAQGLAVAVAYGTLVFAATLPGAVLLLVGRAQGPGPRPRPLRARSAPRPAADVRRATSHG
ncbi:lysylphosphatidylglycerol synthase transmembrane domain-containing protein [Fodinibacter luteus]|uniref:lysylphosphatidylglycerol synthase transmembrane domain-containing protein n=1 Tax=Fodinibacter luteus TaxID=552064 RepID=UPI003CCC84F2